MNIIMISATCCFPGAAPFEEQAQRVVKQAISETGVDAQLKIMPVSAYYSSTREITAKWLADFNQGKVSAPAILIDGKVAFYGVPQLEDMKAALKKFEEITIINRSKKHE